MSGDPARPPDFADTNIWLYALLATQAPQKSAKAQAIIRDTPLIVSTQLINEVCVNLVRKAAFTESQVQELIESFYARHRVVQIARTDLLRSSQLRARYQLSFWDGLMLASALAAGARMFYTEDMHDGLLIEGNLRIVNPFLSGVGHPTQ